MKERRQPVWPRSFWRRALIILLGWAAMAFLVTTTLALISSDSWRDALIFAALSTVTSGPVAALVGAAVTKPGRPMLLDWPR